MFHPINKTDPARTGMAMETATKWVLPMEPASGMKVRTLAGSVPALIAADASAGDPGVVDHND